MSFAFKKFNFLQHTEVSSHAYPKNGTCCATSPAHAFVGCDNGSLVVLDHAFQQVTSFQAHATRVFFVKYLEARQLLLTVGSEEPGYSTTHIKLWDLPHTLDAAARAGATTASGASAAGGSGVATATTQQPVKLVKVFSPKHPEAEITALAAKEVLPVDDTGLGLNSGAATASLLAPGMLAGAGAAAGPGAGGVLAVALGLATGMVYVIQLDLPHGPGGAQDGSGRPGGGSAGAAAHKPPGVPVTASRPISVTKLSARPEAGHAWAITGVALYGDDLDTLALFVVTESQTLSFSLKTHIKSVLDAQGAPSPGCTVLRHGKPGRPAGLPPRHTTAGNEELLPAYFTAPTLLVARDEGLYNYTPDTRAGCTVLEGAKQRLVLLGRFVVVVTQEKSEVGTSSATVLIIDLPHKIISGSLTVHSATSVFAWTCDAPPSSAAPAAAAGTAASGRPLGGPAGAVAAASAGRAAAASKPLLVVVTGSNKLYTFREVPLSMQLESLYKRSLHKLALDLARVQGADNVTIAGIQQRWGDALYGKGEYDAAMVQYMDTIGTLEPSYVIRRFLDAQRIHNLTAYLELLHDRGMAGADHTTLLLNCYTKLKDVEKLDAFIQRSVVQRQSPGGAQTADSALGADLSESTAVPTATGTGDQPAEAAGAAPGKEKKGKKGHKKRSSIGSLLGLLGGEADSSKTARELPKPSVPELKFDAETAVKVLRAAGYPRHALMVAQAAGNPDWQLDIVLEDLSDWDQALDIMSKLPRRSCAAALRRVGKVLVTHRPEPTTGLIMDLCAPAPASVSGGQGYAGSVADFAHLFCDAPTALMLLCEFILNSAPPGTIADERLLYHTLLELYLSDTLEAPGQTGQGTGGGGGSGDTPSGAAITTPGATSAHPTAVAPQPSAAEVDGQDSTPGRSATGPDPAKLAQQAADRQERRTKALQLLHSGWPAHLEQPKYDQEHALVLCRLAGFKEGLVLLYDRLRLYREVMQVHMDSGDTSALVSAALQYGDVSRGGDPQLWALLLEYLARQPAADVERVVVEVVEQIEARGILPAVMVLQLLAANPQLQVSSLREYVARQLSRDVTEAARDREAASRLAADSAALRSELSRLRSQARVFQASRCSATGMPLELPAVHFLCGHAFNARALGDNDRECPLCSPDYRRVVEIRRNMAAGALQQDRFFTELRESSDGFSVVAEHFGRGLMNMTSAALNVDVGGAATHGGLLGLAAMLAPSTSS